MATSFSSVADPEPAAALTSLVDAAPSSFKVVLVLMFGVPVVDDDDDDIPADVRRGNRIAPAVVVVLMRPRPPPGVSLALRAVNNNDDGDDPAKVLPLLLVFPPRPAFALTAANNAEGRANAPAADDAILLLYVLFALSLSLSLSLVALLFT